MIQTHTISIKDRGFLFGDGFFTTVRYDQEPFFFDSHVKRLKKSADLFKIPFMWDDHFLWHHIHDSCKDYPYPCAIKLIVTRGIQEQRGLLNHHLTPQLYTIVDSISEPWIHDFENDFLKDLNNALTCDVSRIMRFSKDPLSPVKKLNYMTEILSRMESLYQDTIILNDQGDVCCTTVGNVVIQTHDQRFLTPYLKSGCVDGIMRQHLIESKKIHERNITIDDLHTASSIFMINSLRGIRLLNLKTA